MLAPQPQLSACLRVIEAATVEARALGWTGTRGPLTERDAKRLSALMEAVHNIPHLLQCWERVNEEWLRADLRKYDDEWGAESHVRLLDSYDIVMSRPPDAG
jgi:hypothetical protein